MFINNITMSSFMQDQSGVRQNAKEISNKKINNMSAKNKEVFSTNFDDHLVDEECRKCNFDNAKDKIEESMDMHEDKEKRKDPGNKTVHWMDEEKKSLMDLGISEAEITKRLEYLMEKRSRKVSSFQIRRNGMGFGIGNNSCGQISSLVIPKKNPFLSKSSSDVNSSALGSALTYMVKNNPFDLPYDPHEEKPILRGDSFENEQSSLGNVSPPKSANCNNEPSFDIDFAFKPLRRLGTSRLAKKEDGKKQSEQDSSILNNVTNDNHAIKEGEFSEKAVNAVNILEKTGGTEASSKEQEVNHDVSSDQSTPSSSSEDEPILRPNKEAILHCLSMSRMRIVSQGNTILRNAESFDCGPSALFDKTKTDGFYFGANKRIHYGSTNSLASDMQVEVSEIGSPTSTNMNFDVDSKGSLVNSTNPSELDLNEMRLRDIDEVSEQDTIDPNALESDDRRIVVESLD